MHAKYPSPPITFWVSFFSWLKIREHASVGHGLAAYFSKAYWVVMTGSKKHNKCAYGAMHQDPVKKLLKAMIFQIFKPKTNSLNASLKFGRLCVKIVGRMFQNNLSNSGLKQIWSFSNDYFYAAFCAGLRTWHHNTNRVFITRWCSEVHIFVRTFPVPELENDILTKIITFKSPMLIFYPGKT